MQSLKRIKTIGILLFIVLLFLLIMGIADVVKRGAGFLFIPSFTPSITDTLTPTLTETPTMTLPPTSTETPTQTASPVNTDTPAFTPTVTREIPSNTPLPTVNETALAKKIHSEAEATIEAFIIGLTPTATPILPDEELSTGLRMTNPADGKSLFFVSGTNQKFWIDWNEVTNGEYRTCVDAGICTEPAAAVCGRIGDYYTSAEYAEFPVVNVDFAQAEKYCQWAGMRLMTQAEWQETAELELIRMEEANLDMNETSPLSRKDLSHLYGNVWEWTRSSSSGRMRIVGGSWKTSYMDHQVQRTGLMPVSYFADDLGFRCVKPID